MGNPYLQRALLVAIDRAGDDVNRVQANLEAWYNSAMDRVSGWYKRRTQWVLLALGLGLAVGLNVNSIVIADFLLRDNTARDAIVAQATAIARDSAIVTGSYDTLDAKLQALNLPMGWADEDEVPRLILPGNANGEWMPWTHFWLPILGWLLTAFAVSMGAPFWFDVLNKFIVIRSTVKPHEKSPEEASEDRQRKGSQQSSQRIGGALPDDGGGDGGNGGGDGDGGNGGDGDGGGGGGGGGGDAGGGTGAGGAPGGGAGGEPGAGADEEEEPEFEARQWNSGQPEEGLL
jgi:hypothetical protein